MPKEENSNPSENLKQKLLDNTSTIKSLTKSQFFPVEKENNGKKLIKLYKEEISLLPSLKILKILSLLTTISLISILKGSPEFPSILGISYCGINYWLLTISSALICVALVFYFGNQIIKKNKFLEDINHMRPKLNNTINRENIFMLGSAALQAGFLGGMLGLGGGVILTPIWLSLGFDAQVTTATSIVAVIFTSFTSTFTVVLNGLVDWQEISFFFPLSFISSFVIAIALKKIIDKTGRKSILLIILIIKISIAIIALPTLTILRIIETGTGIYNFNSFC